MVHDARDDAFSGVWHREAGLAAAVVDEVYTLLGTSEVHVCGELALQLQELHAFEAGDGFCFVHPHVGYRYVSIDAPYFYSVGGEVICGESVGDSDEGYCRFGDCIVLESGNGIEGLFVVPWVFRNLAHHALRLARFRQGFHQLVLSYL